MDIGKHLKEARKRRGMTLREIADSTKLSMMTLHQIERNELDRLPGGIFTRGYLRAYAAEVGVNAEAVVAEYLTQFPAERATEALPASCTADIENAHVGRLVVIEILAIAVAFVVYGWFQDSGQSQFAPSPDPVGAPTPIASLVTEDVGSGTLPAIEPQQTAVRLEIQPTGACWVSVLADGRLVIYRLLETGERVIVTAREELLLRVGDPDVFGYTLNGISGIPLGTSGTPVTVLITSDNYQTFLAGSAPEAGREAAARAT
jgi:cytoskeletal protein RodZ